MASDPPPLPSFGPTPALGAALWALGFIAPVTAAAFAVAWDPAAPPLVRAVLLASGVGGSLLVGWIGGRRILESLRTVSDLLGALREGDYGLRGHVRPGYDPLQGLIAGVNELSDELRHGRLARTAASRFLGKTLVALHSAVIVVDGEGTIRLINPAARRLVGAERKAVVGMAPAMLGFAEAMDAPDGSVFAHRFPTATGRWAVRRATWYSEGRQHTLVMLHDLSSVLSEEEHRAWQRLVRVLSHELNNSLTPIGSLADTLSRLVERHGADIPQVELHAGLEAIARRSGSLARFVGGYGMLARLPPLSVQPFRLDIALSRLAQLERRVPVVIDGRVALCVHGDEDQLGQVFINLMRNAAESALLTGGGVHIDWQAEAGEACIQVVDEGIGLPVSDSLFVPFFTTKHEGSGIGLSLVRLIIEAHGGTVGLANRTDARGAIATVRLKLAT
ncbi:sensor histidine kinase [Luteibacter aegosomatissinici]|uniref:sensor histidine kinase n=1 Tax=Luteibacter aegosomatissinici TaxID=2911539 RepID=UPI001FF803AA|nr:ATP-binding protein [Luteibacter aegosomatissinici]UPG94677.1 ATP-binding protein [Luteibacter aegosomatissinici]